MKEHYGNEVKRHVAFAMSKDFGFPAAAAVDDKYDYDDAFSPKHPHSAAGTSAPPSTRVRPMQSHPGAFPIRGPGYEDGASENDGTVQIGGGGPSVIAGQSQLYTPSTVDSQSRQAPLEEAKDKKACSWKVLAFLILLVVVAGVVLGVVFGVVLKDDQPSSSVSSSAGGSPTASPTVTMSPTGTKSWEEAGEIIVSSDGSTLALSPSGDRVAVIDSRFGFGAGASLEKSLVVRVYEEKEDKVWSQVGKFIAMNSATSLSLLGDRLAVGSLNATVGVTVYELDNNIWNKVGNTIDGEGWAVALAREGNVLAVEETNGVQLYQLKGTNWVPNTDDPLPTLSARNISGNAHSRMAVDDSGLHVLVERTVYKYSDDLQFGLNTDFILESDPPHAPVSMSGDGTVLAIAQPHSNVSGVNKSGNVTVFGFSGTAWQPKGDAITGNIENGLFGWSHSLSGNGKRIVIMNNPMTAGERKATVFRLYGSTWVPLLEDVPVALNKGMVAISTDGGRVAVGGEGIVAIYDIVG